MGKTLTKYLKPFRELTKNELVVLSFVIASFISAYLQGAMILLLPFYVLLTRQLKEYLPKRKSSYLLLAFGISAAISTFLFSGTGYLNGFVLETWYVKLLSVGVIVLIFDIYFFVNVITRRVFLLSLKISAVCSIFCFIVAATQKVLGIYPDPVFRPGRVASTFMNENYYGMLIEFVVLIALFLWFRTKKTNGRIFYTGVIILNLAALWLCQTRMSFVIVGITVFIFLFFHARRVSYAILGVITVIGVVLVFHPTFLPRFNTISSYLDYRLGIWEVAIEAIPNSLLLGRGYYSYCHVWTLVANPEFAALHAHNLYIEVLLNFGIVGTVFLSTYCAIQISRSLKNCKSSGNQTEATLIICMVCAILVHNLADTTVFWPQTGFFAVLLLASPSVYIQEKEVK